MSEFGWIVTLTLGILFIFAGFPMMCLTICEIVSILKEK